MSRGAGWMIQGHIEVFARHGDHLHVAGWLRVAEERLAEDPPRLLLVSGEDRRETPLRRLRERRDLPAKDGQPAGRGFQLLIEAPPAGAPMHACLCLGDETAPLAPSPLRESPFKPRGGMDAPDGRGIRGWVFQPPGAEASVLVDGTALPLALGLPRPDLPFDDGTETPLLGFQLPLETILARLRADAPGRDLFDGEPHEFVLVASGQEITRRAVTLAREMLAPPVRPDPRFGGHVEVFAREGGFLHIGGWLRAPEEVLAEAPPRLVLTWGEERREWPLRRLRERRDLPAQGERPAGRGFQLLTEAPATEAPASATLLIGEQAVPLTPALLEPAPFRPRGGMDQPDREGLRGWVVDLAGRQPSLLLEGCQPLPVPLNLHRPDLPYDDGTEQPAFGFHLPLEALAAALRQDRPEEALFDGRPRELVLMASGTELARRSLAMRLDAIGMLERVGNGEASGWLAERGRPMQAQAVDLLLDGTRWASVEAAIPRPDLAKHNIIHRGGGFRIALPSLHPGEGGPLPVAAVPRHGADSIPGATVLEGLPPWRKDRGEVAWRLPADGRVPVSVVIPIHNAAAELERCVESVLCHTTGPARLILVDDASTQPEIAALLRRWEGLPGVEIHRQAENQGFTRTANRGIALAGRDDVVLLNSDTEVGPDWLDGLRAAAHSGPRTGSATAVSNNAGVVSVPEFNAANPMPPWFGVEEMARLVRGAALSLYPAVPTGHGFCLYLRRALLDAVGVLDAEAFPRGYGEENDLCMRALRAGFEHVVDDRSFVWHQRSASFGAEKAALIASARTVLDERYPEYRALIRVFEGDPAMLAMRWRVRRALDRASAGGEVPRPRLLTVISTESGGTPQTNRDLMEALSDRYEPWVLRCDSRTITLSRHRASGAEVVETHALERPIEPATHRSGEYDRLVGDMLLRHGFELVHVRHILWHSLGLVELCRRLGVPVVFSFHDFYTACPTVKLLDAEGRFCAGPCTAGEADCTAELWKPETMPPLRHRFVYRWQAMMGEALEGCDAFITTSPSARETLLANFPFLAGRDFRVIPHGRSFARMEMLAAEPSLDEKLRVLVPGNVSASKGGGLVAAMAELDRGREVEFHVLGAVDSSLATTPGIVLHGRYDRADFASHVARIRPHLGAVLSLWPETYCHTLTECWAAGLPVMATALGALAERLTETPGGWLVDRWMEPEAMLALLRRLRREPGEVRARRNAVMDWQATTGRHRDAAAMAVEYDQLYREVLDRRRTFQPPASPPRVVLTLDAPAGPLPTPLAVATRNAVSRPFIFRRITPSFPLGHAPAGPADAVLVAPDALGPDDLAALRRRCAAAGLPLLEAGDLDLGHGLEAAPWLSTEPSAPASPPPEDGPFPVLYLATPEDPALPALRPVFEDLTALGVATLHVIGGPPAGSWFRPADVEGDTVAALRRAGRAHRLGLARPGPAMLALQATGLPVLSLPPDLLSDDPKAAELARYALLRDLAELTADAPRRTAMAVEGARAARAAIQAAPPGRELDARIAALLDHAAPSKGPQPAAPVMEEA